MRSILSLVFMGMTALFTFLMIPLAMCGGLVVPTFIVFLVLKLIDKVHWEWFWIFSPLIGYASAWVGLLLLAGISWVGSKVFEPKSKYNLERPGAGRF